MSNKVGLSSWYQVPFWDTWILF